MIPDGWVLCSFGDIVIKSQYGLSVPSSPDGKFYIFKMNNFKDGKMNPDKVDKVNLSDVDLDKFTLKYGDLLVNRTNSIDLVGKTGVFDLEGVFTFASYLVRFQVNRAIADPFFVNFFFNCSKSQKKLKEIATLGVSQANINPTSLQKYFNLLLPPLPEQCKIAEILGAWDDAISTLEKLITAKRKLKQGLMQQLLTGKKRFKEFEGSEWLKSTIKDVAKVVTGNTPSTSVSEYYDGSFLFVSPADLGEHKYIANTEKKLSAKGFETCRKIPRGSTLFTCIGSTIGKTGMAAVNLATNQQINSIVPKSINNDFIYYSLVKIAPFIKRIASTQAIPIINKSEFEKQEILHPLNLQEQEKIASVLSAADTEISNLEKQLAAYKQQKRGLMQQLLTGKTRVRVN